MNTTLKQSKDKKKSSDGSKQKKDNNSQQAKILDKRSDNKNLLELQKKADAFVDHDASKLPEKKTPAVTKKMEVTPKEISAGETITASKESEIKKTTPLEEESTATATEDGKELSPSLDKKERSFLAKNGDEIVDNVSVGASSAGGVGKGVSMLNKKQDPAKEGSSIMEKTKEVFNKASSKTNFFKILSKIPGIAKPLVTAYNNIQSAIAKKSQWVEFEKATIDPKTKEKKAGAPKEAEYGLSKIWKGFVRTIKNVIMAISDFTANLLLLIPGAQLVAGPWKAFNTVVGAIESVFKGGKSVYQWIRGEKKDVNSVSLLDKAIKGDQASLELIYNLKLDSICGSGFSFIDSIAKNTQSAKDYIKVKLGWSEEQASRIVDMTQTGGPKSVEELKTQLQVIASKEDSKKLIINDLKEAMTGYGT